MSVRADKLVIGKKYTYANKNMPCKKLTSMVQTGAGGSGGQEPYYTMTFEDGTQLTGVDWDEKFTSCDIGGGKNSRRKRRTLGKRTSLRKKNQFSRRKK